MTELSVLHVVPRFHHGGPTSSVLAQQRHAQRLGLDVVFQTLALEPGGSRDLVTQAMRQRLRVHVAPDPLRERELVAGADVIVLDWWNTPSMWSFIDRWRGQELRWIVHNEVNGLHQPQRLPASLAQAPCHVVLTSPNCTDLRTDGEWSLIPEIAEAGSPTNADPQPGRLIHIGTVNVFKLDPAVVDLHAAAIAVGGTVLVLGSGGDEERFAQRAAELGLSHGIKFPGFAADPDGHVAQATAFVAPTPDYGYGSCDKAVQSAQLRGVPVLTYRDSPIAFLIQPGVTGWYADDRAHYMELAAAVAVGDLHLPAAGVAAAAAEQHNADAKIRALTDVFERVASGLPRPVDDGFPGLTDWLAEQVGVDGVLDQDVVATLVAARRPALADLIGDSALLQAHGRWGCEGGYAQFAATFGNPADLVAARQ